MNKNNIYLYFHINPVTQTVFYVGIGNKNRPYNKKDRTKHWHNIVNKYGYQVIIIHSGLTMDMAKELEIKYIAQIGRADKGLGSLINYTNGGDGIKGYKHTEETKAKLRKPKTEEHKNKLKGPKGPLSQEHKDSISLTKIGGKHKETTRRKISKSLSKNSKPIKQFTLDGRLIKEYLSIPEASRKTGIGKRNIWQAAHNPNIHAGGFRWSYS